MIFAAFVAVLGISFPGIIVSDTFTTGKNKEEQRRPGSSMQGLPGSWATKEYRESTYTDSPLIEWTILQKTTDVFESSENDETQPSVDEFSETTVKNTEYDYVTNYISEDRMSDVTDDVPGDVTGDVTSDVTDDVPGDVTGDVTSVVMDEVTSDVMDEVTSDVSDDVTSDVTGDVTHDALTVEVTTEPLNDYSENNRETHRTNIPFEETSHDSYWTTSRTTEDDTDVTTSPTEPAREYVSTTLHKFTEDCVYDISRTSGEIIFPDNEHLPRANSSEVLTCKWRIRTPIGPNIRVHFRKLELELGSEYLEIAVGMGGNKATRLITGTKLPADIIIEGTELWLTLKSRQKDGFTQVSLTFDETFDNSTFPVSDNTTCGGLLVEMEGNVSSPGYPDNYRTNEECTWFIAAPAHSVIQMTIVEFKTEVYDQVRIGVGLLSKAPASRLLTLFGELVHERETIVPANSLWINFYSDDTVTTTGFFIKYKIIPRDICNTSNVFDSESGVITSVNYPNPYPINSECTWTILGHPGSYINMTFHDLRIQDGRDFVLVGQGKEVFDGPFTTYTGNITRSFTLTVKASNAWLHFTSDHLMGDEGFTGFNLSYLVFEQQHKETTPRPTPSDVLVEETLQIDQLPRKDVLIFRLTGVQKEDFGARLPEFRTELARIVNERCQASTSCRKGGGLLRTEDVEVESLTTEGEQLVVEVILRTVLAGDYAMGSLDYDELEKLFHSDLQTLDLQHGPGGSGGVDASKLPEWLIGVIVVVILLIAVFFAMVIYSLVKERKKQRAGSYGANTSSASMCDEVEVGKDDANIRITSFIVDNEKASANGWVDTEASTLQRRPQAGIHGCMNPAYVDEDDQAKPKVEKKKEQKSKGNEKDNSTSENKDKSHEADGNTDKEDTEVETKTTTNDTPTPEKDCSEEAVKEQVKTVETHEVEVNETDSRCVENDSSSQKEATEPSNSEKEEHPDLSTNL